MLTDFPTVNIVNVVEAVGLKSELLRNGFYVYEINGKHIETQQEFFATVSGTLPFDPPISGQVNYDAFVDSLWEGVVNSGYDQVAILWHNAHYMVRSSLGGFLRITECLWDVARDLASTELGIERPIKLKIFLIGKWDSLGIGA